MVRLQVCKLNDHSKTSFLGHPIGMQSSACEAALPAAAACLAEPTTTLAVPRTLGFAWKEQLSAIMACQGKLFQGRFTTGDRCSIPKFKL